VSSLQVESARGEAEQFGATGAIMSASRGRAAVPGTASSRDRPRFALASRVLKSRAVGRSVAMPVVLTLVLACVFVVARLHWVVSGDASRFVVAGDSFTDARKAPPDLYVFKVAKYHRGYDGQFYYRMALDPFDLSASAHGITMDAPLRFQRVTYPALAFVLSGGSSQAVPWALVAVNILALGVLAGIGGLLAQSSGRHVMWGLVFPAYYGLVFTLSRDLTEIVEVALLLGGLLALRRSRWLLAAVLLAAAVLTRETALFAVAGIAAYRLLVLVRRWSRPGPSDLAWIVPAAAFAAWQIYCLLVIGRLPATSAPGNRFVFPGRQLIDAIPRWFRGLNSGTWAVHTLECVTLLAILGLALVALRSTTAPIHERAAFIGLLLGALSVGISSGLWTGIDHLRFFADVYVLAGLVILGTKWRLVIPAAIVGTCTTLATVLMATSI
jgi:hypothetical protein